MDDGAAEPTLGLRALTRASVRDAVAARALELFDERGFDSTTVDDIAGSLGISPRSFFRYFAAKEDVVIGDPSPMGVVVRDAAAARPAGEPVWTVLRRALDPISDATTTDQARSLRIMRVMMKTPSLRAGSLEKHITWAALLEPAIVDRLDGYPDARRLRAQALIHSALACLDVALAEWTRLDGSRSVAVVLDEAFAVFDA